MPVQPQNRANHVRYVPLFHFGLLGILVVNLAWTIRHVVQSATAQHWMDLLMALAFLIFWHYVRRFPVTVQDRVIRLEESLRLARLAPDLAGRASELTRDQWIGLRFASDAELPALARKVLDERIADRDAIKALVQDWRADYLRA